jgi:hypothetical protein
VFRGVIAVVFCGFALGASAQQSEGEKLCIFSAAQKLPSIPGLVITGSRAKPLPQESRKKSERPSKVSAVKVEIDIKAASQEGTYEFICSSGPGGPVFITPVGLSGRHALGNTRGEQRLDEQHPSGRSPQPNEQR